MEYTLKERLLRILKIVAITLVILANIIVSIFFLSLYNKEKEKRSQLESEKVVVEAKLNQAEAKIEEQAKEIEDLKTVLSLGVNLSNSVGENNGKTDIVAEVSTEKLLEKHLVELQAGNTDVIKTWFGLGTEFTSENISKVTKYAKITVIEDKNTPDSYIAVHICNIDYRKMKKDYDELYQEYVKKNYAMKDKDRRKLVQGLLDKDIDNGKYDRCYKVYVKNNEGMLEITEDLKQAITGGWYLGTGDVLEKYKCIYED